jgi:ipoprotein LpqH
MRNRIQGGAAAVALILLVGCTTRPPTQIAATATVTVDGNDVQFNIVNCKQVEWYRTIHIGGDFAGATVQVDERREPVTVPSVRIQNVRGFTGMYSEGDGSEPAKVSLNSGKFTISGSAHGSTTDKPNEPTTAAFKIFVTC